MATPSALVTSCPECTKDLRVREDHAGKTVRCPACQKPFKVTAIRSSRDSTKQTASNRDATEIASRVVSMEQPAAPATDSRSDSADSSESKGSSGSKASEPTLKTIGRFEIKALIGEGGFGRVYRAYDPQLDRMVALKIPSLRGSDSRGMKRFLTEAKAAAQLRHPNIVPTFDSGKENGLPYIASGYINGQSLDQRLSEGRIPPRQAALWIGKLSGAVHYAHEQGIIHRDIKPHNVMLDEKGQPQLMDFGLAKRVGEDANMTVDGTLMGTPTYMSPEQARGDHTLVGPKSDQYSVGVMLYELLTGKRPFNGPPHSVISQVIAEEPPTIRSHDPSLSKDLDAICQKAMSKDPAKRYKSTSDLADDLLAWLNGQPISARTPGFLEQRIKWVRNNPVTTGLSVLLVGSLLIGVLVSMSYAFHSQQMAKEAGLAEASAKEQSAIAQRETERAQKAEASAKEQAAIAQRELQRATMATMAEAAANDENAKTQVAHQSLERTLARNNYFLAVECWETNRQADAIELLEKIPPRLRHFEWNIIRRQCEDGHMMTLRSTENDGLNCVSFSPDGRRIVSGSHGNTFKLWDAESGKELRTLQGHSSKVTNVAFSPDGRRIISGSDDNTIKLWDAESGEELRTLKGHSDSVRSVTFSPDGRQIVSGSLDSTIKLWDVASGMELRTLKGHSNYVSSVSFSPNGRQIVSGSADKKVKLWDAESGEELRTLNGHSSTVRSVAFSPDGRRIVSGSADKKIKLWDAETGAELRSLEGHTSDVYGVSFSPDGTRIVSGSADKTIKLWDVANGVELRTLEGHSDSVRSVTFSPDGRKIVSGSWDQTIKLWEVASGEELRTLNGHFSRVFSVSFSPDGRQIVSGSADKTIKLWDVETGEEFRTLKGHSFDVTSVSFSPDGRQIVSGSLDQTIKLWDAETGAELRSLEGHSSYVHGVSFSPDGRQIVSGSADKTIKVWDSESGEELRTLKGHSDSVRSVTFSPDGRQIVSGSLDQTIKLWNVASGVELRTLKGHSHYVTSVSFSPDGRQIVSGSADNKVKLWDAESGEELRTLNGHTSSVRSVAFSFDGRRIVSGSLDQTIKLWDSESGDELKTLNWHSGSVESVASSPDGRRIVSGSYDLTIKLWYGTPLDNEALNRQLLAEFWRPKPKRHLSLAREAVAREDWYAATFQFAWAVKLQPDSAENRSLFTDAYKKMVAKYGGTKPPTPPIVAEAIVITKSTPSGDATRLPTPQPPNPVPSSDSNPNAKTFVNGIGAKMVLIPAGTFLMGSPDSDSEAHDDEKPQHAVTLTRSFYMGATEVTQGQWKAVMGTEPWKGQGDVREGANYPATYVSWDEAVEYCRRLSDREGREYRLPTEAEWEYACRGGKSTKYSFGDDATLLPQYAWFADNAEKINEGYAHLVQQKLVNPFGLYDMHGNVWEWCSDRYGYRAYPAGPATDPEGPGDGASRVLRGGSWVYGAAVCRTASRVTLAPSYRDASDGLRLALISVSQ